MSEAARHPEELTHTVTTTDGTPVFVRAIRPAQCSCTICLAQARGIH
ncbi:MAG: hypothetical protein ACREF4_02525 [Gammaproteobacteria bacterium]